MTPKNLFSIIIKIMGIYLIFESLYLIIPFITETLYVFRQQDSSTSFIEVFLGLVIVGGIYFLIFYYSIFKTEVIVDKLNLDRGFSEEKIELNIHRSTILRQ